MVYDLNMDSLEKNYWKYVDICYDIIYYNLFLSHNRRLLLHVENISDVFGTV